MKIQNIVSNFVLFILLMILMWVGVTYVSQNIQYSSAKKFHGNVVERIENSYFNAQVMKDCERKAKQNGYLLLIEIYGGKFSRDAKVKLEFCYTFPVIQTTKKYIFEGYAR